MNRIILFFLIIVIISGASYENTGKNIIKSLPVIGSENMVSIPVVDYNKLRKAVSNFKFFPVSFYISSDECGSIANKLYKDSDVDFDVCIGFNVIDDFHYLRIELITPEGAIYQSLNIFIDKPDAAPKVIRFKNDYTEYPISKPKILKSLSLIESKLPIAGSSIQTQNLTGRWRADLYIDESREPYGTHEFEIE